MSWLFFRSKRRVVALVDVHSQAISAGYVILEKGKLPIVVESVRLPLDPHATEPNSEALSRVLSATLERLVKTGSSALLARAGSGSVDEVLIAVATPWQTHTVSLIEQKTTKQLVITRELLKSLLSKQEVPGRVVSHQIQKVLLNGYTTKDPYGKRASHVQLLVSTSSLLQDMHELLLQQARSAFHTKAITLTSLASECVSVLEEVYGEDSSYVLLDVGSISSEVLCIKHSFLSAISSKPVGTHDLMKRLKVTGTSEGLVSETGDHLPATGEGALSERDLFVDGISELLGELATHETLPQTIYTLCEPGVFQLLQGASAVDSVRAHWLGQTPKFTQLSVEEFRVKLDASSSQQISLPVALLALGALRSYFTG